MKDSDLRLPSSEFRAPLGAEGSHLAWIELPKPAGERRETKGSGAEEAAKGPSAPRSPDKAAPGKRCFSHAIEEGRTPGPATRAAASWGPDTRPHGPRPRNTGEHSPPAGRGGGRAAGQSPRPRLPPRARGPRGLPPLSGLSSAGRAVGPRETKEPPPLHPPRPPEPASPRTPPQPPGPARPHPFPGPRAGRPRPLDGRPCEAGASGVRQGRSGAALTAATPGRRGAVGELG